MVIFHIAMYSKTLHIYIYPLAFKRGNGKSFPNGSLNGKIIYKWWILQQAMFDDTGGYIHITNKYTIAPT